MRDFFINMLGTIVSVIIVLMAIAVAIGGVAAMFQDGLLAGLAVWFGGGIYVLVFGGMLFLVLGIHDNTKRTAEAVEQLVARGS